MAGTVDAALSYVFTWQGILDSRTCQKCRRLIGKQWRDQDLFQAVLWDPIDGDIFDLNRGVPLTHGRGPHHCRCTVTVDVIVDEDQLVAYLLEDTILRETILRQERPVTIYREAATGRFTSPPG